MAVVRINKTKDYTIMSNHHFRERDMSLKAKGLLSLMLSLPDNWDYSIEGLCVICKESTTAIRNILKELESFKYLTRTRKQNNKGQFEYEYDIFERPSTGKPKAENPQEEKPHTENPYTGNQLQLNTKELNTKELNINNIKKERKKKITTYDKIINEKVSDDTTKELLYEFIKMRNMKKKPLTDRALTIQINKLNNLSADIEIQKKIIEKSIVKCWDEFYPYKEENIYEVNKRTNGIDTSKYDEER